VLLVDRLSVPAWPLPNAAYSPSQEKVANNVLGAGEHGASLELGGLTLFVQLDA
jgi:hypothetical protein